MWFCLARVKTRMIMERGVLAGRVKFEYDPRFGWWVYETTAGEPGDGLVRVGGVWEGEEFARSQGWELMGWGRTIALGGGEGHV